MTLILEVKMDIQNGLSVVMLHFGGGKGDKQRRRWSQQQFTRKANLSLSLPRWFFPGDKQESWPSLPPPHQHPSLLQALLHGGSRPRGLLKKTWIEVACREEGGWGCFQREELSLVNAAD